MGRRPKKIFHPGQASWATLLVFWSGTFAGCAPILSTLQPAGKTPQGHARGAFGIGASVPLGAIQETVEITKTLTKNLEEGITLSEDDVTNLFEGVIGLTLSPPSISGELQGRWGLSETWDLGLRVARGAARLDGRYQFWESGPNAMDASIGFGLGFYGKEIPLGKLEEFLTIDRFSRAEIDFPLLFGWSGRWGHFWFGPKVVLVSYKTGMTLHLPDNEIRLADVSGSGAYSSLQIGGALGYRAVWLAVELTAANLKGEANLTVGDNLSTSPQYGGLVLYPIVGIILEI